MFLCDHNMYPNIQIQKKTDLKQNITLKALAEIAHALSRPAEIHRH